jgi:hypothetical protein
MLLLTATGSSVIDIKWLAVLDFSILNNNILKNVAFPINPGITPQLSSQRVFRKAINGSQITEGTGRNKDTEHWASVSKTNKEINQRNQHCYFSSQLQYRKIFTFMDRSTHWSTGSG